MFDVLAGFDKAKNFIEENKWQKCIVQKDSLTTGPLIGFTLFVVRFKEDEKQKVRYVSFLVKDDKVKIDKLFKDIELLCG